MGPGVATVVNAGSIQAAQTINTDRGVFLTAGGAVTNQSGGVISGFFGLMATGGAATVVNAGSIEGNPTANGGQGAYLAAGGLVTNQASAMIGGYFFGILAQNTAVTVVNAGSIGGSAGIGIYLAAGGSVTNQGSGTIGGSAFAVKFGPDTAGTLTADPGAVFAGGVYGGGGATLELASASSAGSIASLGTTVTNFASLVRSIRARARTVSGNALPAGLGTLAISGFAAGDTIDVTNFAATNQTFASNELTLGDGASNYITLHVAGTLSATNFRFGHRRFQRHRRHLRVLLPP